MLILALGTLLAAQDGMVHGTVNAGHANREFNSGDILVSLTSITAREPVSPGLWRGCCRRINASRPTSLLSPSARLSSFPIATHFFTTCFRSTTANPSTSAFMKADRLAAFVSPNRGVLYFLQHSSRYERRVRCLPTPYFALSARDGSFHIDHVPPGKYKLEVWYELASPAELASLTREVEITSAEDVLPALTLHASDSHSDHLEQVRRTLSTGQGLEVLKSLSVRRSSLQRSALS